MGKVLIFQPRYVVALVQDVTSESEAISKLTKELRALDCQEGVEFSNKATLLMEELKTVTRNILARVETLQPYVGFLHSAQEVAVFSFKVAHEG